MHNYRMRGVFTAMLLLLAPIMALAQPVPGFTIAPGDSTEGCSPLVVNFVNTTTGATSYVWDFGNGNTSTLVNPGATYSAPGQYTVKLVATGPGGVDSVVQTNYITVFQDPQAAFTSNITMGCAPLTVNFSDLSTPGDAPISAWLWDFGDGNISMSQNPTHTFASVGSFNVSLVVVDTNGCSTTLLLNNYIQTSDGPNISFTANPTNACVPPLMVNFTNTTTGIAPLTYQWDFGDGSPTSNAQNPSHTYTTAGSYTVTLIVTDGLGCADTLVDPNLIIISDVFADFSANDTTVCTGDLVTFTDLSTGGPNSWMWNFGDGNTSTAQNPTHTYNTPGNYPVTLAVSSPAGCNDTEVKTTYITVDPSPVAQFTADTLSSCEVPFDVQFTDQSTGTPTGWMWDFGDGNTSTAQNPMHTYTAPGTYTVTLTVTNALGCSDTHTEINYIVIVPPVAAFTPNPLQGCAPQLVTFNDNSTSGSPIVMWEWDFGDGNTSNLQNPTNTYIAPGPPPYIVTLIITNAQGCTDTVTQPYQVGDNPIANFTYMPDTICYGESVQFTDMSTNATGWAWDFGDGGVSFIQNPNYTYQDTGCFNVTLTATNGLCQDVITIPNAVCVLPPIADFDLNPAVGCDTPHAVVFTDQSAAPDTWLWDF
ncbi:MAG: PKD domain-containing protein, partial [Bacteroidota bacterium]